MNTHNPWSRPAMSANAVISFMVSPLGSPPTVGAFLCPCVGSRAGRVMDWGMRLEPLYRMEFTYPHGWSVALGDDGTESQHLYLAEGHCEGDVSGSLRGVNHRASPRGRHLLP